MLQRGGVYPGDPPAEALHLFAAYYDDPTILTRCSPGSGWPTWPAHRGAGSPAASSSGCRSRWPWWAGREVAFLDEPTAGVDVARPPG